MTEGSRLGSRQKKDVFVIFEVFKLALGLIHFGGLYMDGKIYVWGKGV
jgi:hypothetical protein